MSDRNADQLTTEPAAAAEGAQQPAVSAVRIGPLTVQTDTADVEAFRCALGSRATYGPVPLTFPIRWLSLPDVRGKISRTLGLDHAALVQQSQTFRYTAPLECNRKYSFEVAARRMVGSFDRTLLHSSIRDAAGNEVLTMETTLRKLHIGHLPPKSERGRRSNAANATDGMMLLRVEPFDFARIQRYTAASLDHNPLHSDIEIARAVGFDGLIVHGMLVMGQFEPALSAWRPDLRVTRLYGTFLQPLPVSGQIAVSGRVVKASAEDGGHQLILRLVARADRGEVVCVGEVSARSGSACVGYCRPA